MNNRDTASGSLFTLGPRATVLFCASAVAAFAEPTQSPLSPTNIVAPVSSPAQPICGHVVVLFLAAARVIGSIQNAARSDNAFDVKVIGHQFW